MADQLSISNNALGELAADPINSIDEASLSARESKRVFTQVYAEMLTWTDWDFAIARVNLALQENDRVAEWAYRYAKPSDMAKPLRILPFIETGAVGMPTVGPFTFPAWDALGRFQYQIASGSIYTNLEKAVFEYQSNNVPVAKVDALTARAIELEMAARLAMPLKKSRELKGDVIKQAELARQRAVADSENRSPRVSIDYVSPIEYARDGYLDGGYFPASHNV